jgi:hypothetical protein
MHTKPPTAVSPDMAFVTDIRGECRAGATPQTVWYPQIEANPNLDSIAENAGLGDKSPNARAVPTATVAVFAFLQDSSNGSATAVTDGAEICDFFTGGGGDGANAGAGHMRFPSCATSAPRTA